MPRDDNEAAISKLGATPRLEFHSPNNLIIDDRYQRSISNDGGKKLIRRIVENFFWPFFGVIVATDNGDGTYCIIDGQHRAEAARQHPDVHSVPVMVIEEMTLMEQARAFVEINQNRLRLNALQVHRASVRAGDPVAVEVDKIAQDCGVTIPPNNLSSVDVKPGQTLSVKSLVNIHRVYGAEILKATLETVMQAYANTAGDLRAEIFKAVAIALSKNPELGDFIAARLRTTDAISWIERAKGEAKVDGVTTAVKLAQILAGAE